MSIVQPHDRSSDPRSATDTLAGLERVDIPYGDIFDESIGDVSLEFYRLFPGELTARTEDSTR